MADRAPSSPESQDQPPPHGNPNNALRPHGFTFIFTIPLPQSATQNAAAPASGSSDVEQPQPQAGPSTSSTSTTGPAQAAQPPPPPVAPRGLTIQFDFDLQPEPRGGDAVPASNSNDAPQVPPLPDNAPPAALPRPPPFAFPQATFQGAPLNIPINPNPGAGGMGFLPLPFFLFDPSRTQQPPDPERAKELLKGLKDPGRDLMIRLERIMKAENGFNGEQGDDFKRVYECPICMEGWEQSPDVISEDGYNSDVEMRDVDASLAPEEFARIKEGGGSTGLLSFPCHHVYHKDCLEPWFSSNKTTCPSCRFDIDPLSTTLRLPANQPRHNPFRPRPTRNASGNAPRAGPYDRAHSANAAANASNRPATADGSDRLPGMDGEPDANRPPDAGNVQLGPGGEPGQFMFLPSADLIFSFSADGEVGLRSRNGNQRTVNLNEVLDVPAAPADANADASAATAVAVPPPSAESSPSQLESSTSPSPPVNPIAPHSADSDNPQPENPALFGGASPQVIRHALRVALNTLRMMVAPPLPDNGPQSAAQAEPPVAPAPQPMSLPAGSSADVPTSDAPSPSAPAAEAPAPPHPAPAAPAPFGHNPFQQPNPFMPQNPQPRHADPSAPRVRSDKQWIPPVGRLTLDEWVTSRERDLQWRCDDPICMAAPPEHAREVSAGAISRWAKSSEPLIPLISVGQERLPGTSEGTTGAILLGCEHHYHPRCLRVSCLSSQSWNHEEGSSRINLRCPRCRKEAWVDDEMMGDAVEV